MVGTLARGELLRAAARVPVGCYLGLSCQHGSPALNLSAVYWDCYGSATPARRKIKIMVIWAFAVHVYDSYHLLSEGGLSATSLSLIACYTRGDVRSLFHYHFTFTFTFTLRL